MTLGSAAWLLGQNTVKRQARDKVTGANTVHHFTFTEK
jgi:hypothetical protein